MKREHEETTDEAAGRGEPVKSAKAGDAAGPSSVAAAAQPPAAAGATHKGGGFSFTAPSAVTAGSIDTSLYDAQLDAKLAKLKELFGDMAMPPVEVHTSPPTNYRLRAEFNMWGTKPGISETPHYVMFATAPAVAGSAAAPGETEAGEQAGDQAAPAAAAAAEDGAAGAAEGAAGAAEGAEPAAAAAAAPAAAPSAAPAAAAAAAAGAKAKGGGRKGGRGGGKPPPKPKAERVEVKSFPVGSVLMNELMVAVLEAIKGDALLRDGLFQVNYHTALSGDSMVTFLYHKKLDEAWTARAHALRPLLAAAAPSANGHVPHVLGRSRKQKISVDEDFVVEKLNVAGKEYVYRQHEGAFSQPNGRVCEKMLAWAVDATLGCGDHDLLELYCGNGNFTVPLAHNFRRVVATEISKVGVDAAQWNMEANGIKDKTFVARLSSEEFVETWKAQGTRRRLEGLWPWSELDLRTLFVDPPRAGLDPESCKLMAQFERIVYISCNPETLHANLAGIAGVTHTVERFAAFDQFPFTHHLETGVYLVRKPQPGDQPAVAAPQAR